MPAVTLTAEYDANRPSILYDNIANDSASSIDSYSQEVSGYPVENAFDDSVLTFWGLLTDGTDDSVVIDAGSAVSADCFGIYATNLHNYPSVSYKLQYSTDKLTWNDCFAARAKSTSAPEMIRFTQVSARYWRVLLSSPSGLSLRIGFMSWGTLLNIPRGIAPPFQAPELGDDWEVITGTNEDGQFITQRAINRGKSFDMDIQDLEGSWVVSNWKPFIDHIVRRPFLMNWNSQLHADSAIFCYMKGVRVTPPSYKDSVAYVDVTVSLRGVDS